MALRRNPPARNPREGVLQYINKERKKERGYEFFLIWGLPPPHPRQNAYLGLVAELRL